MTEQKRFYSSKYWQKDTHGRRLWQMRKMFYLVTAVSNPDTPNPFITEYSDDPKVYGGVVAHWEIRDANQNSQELTIEYENDCLMIFAMRVNDEGAKFDFWYEFDENFGRPEVEDQTENRAKLELAIDDAKSWLESKRNDLKTSGDRLASLFNL